jgi:hypothetical protein
MKTMATILGLALVALVGCDGSSESSGFDVNPPGDMRGDVDAGGAGGSAGMSGAGGAAGAVGSVGGHVGAGGSGAGGATSGAGGSSTGSLGGAGGSDASYVPCSVYSWSPANGGGCSKQSSPGVFLTGYKDGHRCGVCSSPARPSGVPECEWSASSAICVLSCDECTFQ